MIDDIQYISDSLAMEELYSITKEAGIASSMLEGISSFIKNYVRENIDTSSGWALVKSVAGMLTPAVLFRINPLIWGIYEVAQYFGINISGILETIAKPVIAALSSGNLVSLDSITNHAKSLMSTSSLAPLPGLIKEATSGGSIDKYAQRRRRTSLFGGNPNEKGVFRGDRSGQQAGGNILFAPKDSSLLYKIFGARGKKGAAGLIIAVVAWLVKTVIGSAMLAGGVSAAKGLLPGSSEDSKSETPSDGKIFNIPGIESLDELETVTVGLGMDDRHEIGTPSSGAGTQWHENDEQTAWLVPLIGDVKNTLLEWAVEIYPQLNGYENEIRNLPSFNKIASLLSRGHNKSGSRYLVVPEGFNRRIDIVNTFAKDAFNLVKITL